MTLPKLPATLVTGPAADAREAGIAAALEGAPGRSAAILEGLPDPRSILTPSDSLAVARIAPGCICCSGNLVLRVTLNRVLRGRPARLYIGLANTEHLDQLRSWLQQPPYDQLLELTPDLRT
ncbi:GTPase [Massilia cavernae]|uniref:GTPase n=1 Tax=Massilia cavernae TaxID=2320864 RepID=A0A418XSA2_9BURK|nr:GTPase [Massilia cavernae]RJG15427.1 GTPase [Massilia cavernae]